MFKYRIQLFTAPIVGSLGLLLTLASAQAANPFDPFNLCQQQNPASGPACKNQCCDFVSTIEEVNHSSIPSEEPFGFSYIERYFCAPKFCRGSEPSTVGAAPGDPCHKFECSVNPLTLKTCFLHSYQYGAPGCDLTLPSNDPNDDDDIDEPEVETRTLNIVFGIRGMNFIPGHDNEYYTWLRQAVRDIEEKHQGQSRQGDLVLLEAYFEEAWGYDESVKALTDTLVEFIATSTNPTIATSSIFAPLSFSSTDVSLIKYDKINILFANFCSGTPMGHNVLAKLERLRPRIESRHQTKIDSMRILNIGPNYSFGFSLAVHAATFCPSFWPDCLGGAASSFGQAIDNFWSVITSAQRLPNGSCAMATLRTTDDDFVNHDPFSHSEAGDLAFREHAQQFLHVLLREGQFGGLSSGQNNELQSVWQLNHRCQESMLK